MTTKSFLVLGLAGLSTVVNASPIKARGYGGANKRGIAYNNPAMCDLFDASKFSWKYNWVSMDWNDGDWHTGPEYVPMLHSWDAEWTSVWNNEVDMAIGKGSKHVLSFNEPDQCGEGTGGACMLDYSKAAETHKNLVESLRQRHPDIKIGTPAVTSDAEDPNKGVRYLAKFLDACKGCNFDFTATHWNGPASAFDYFTQHIEASWKTGGQKPLWVTEFKCFEGESLDPAARAVADDFMQKALKFLDETPYVERYAYHYATPNVLVTPEGNAVSDLGNTYTNYHAS